MAESLGPSGHANYVSRKIHITETLMTSSNWYKHVNWLNVALIVGIPIYGCIQAFWVPLQLKTASGRSSTTSPRDWYHSWVPQTMGTYILLCYSPSSNCPGRTRRWCGGRLNPMVGTRPPSPPPIYRYRQGPILRSQGSPLLSLWLDGHEAEPKENRPYRHLRPQ